jgi:hypothetical protein
LPLACYIDTIVYHIVYWKIRIIWLGPGWTEEQKHQMILVTPPPTFRGIGIKVVALVVYTVITPNLIVSLIVYTVIAPTSGDTPTAGQAYSLSCSLTGITDIYIVTYQWFKGLASNGTQLTDTSQLQFSPLRASDAGLYTCRATVNSVQIEETLSATYTVTIISRKCINTSVLFTSITRAHRAHNHRCSHESSAL